MVFGMLLLLINYLIILTFMYLITGYGLRESMIRSYILILGIVVGLTEILSLVNQITRPAIMISWSVLAFILLGILGLTLWKKKTGVLEVIKDRFSKKPKPYSSFEIVIMICIGLILFTTFIIAIYSPPNNFDSMTYHMARVSHWIQNQDVNYYPTSIPRQNYSMPLAEYVILHLQILSKTDVFSNLVQWSAFGLIIVLVSKIADFLQISRKGQLLTALFSATLPMAILQSSSTQNDLITGLGCLSFAYFLLKLIREKNWKNVVFSGLSMGLALLTKGTAYIYCAAIGVVISISGLLYGNWKNRLFLSKKLIVVIVLALFLNIGVYSRNMNLYSHPLSTNIDRTMTDRFSIRGLYTNLIRNGAVQLTMPVPELNPYLTRLISDFLGENNTNPEYIFTNSEFLIEYKVNEDESGNPLHVIFLIVGLFFYPWQKDVKRSGLSALLISMMLSTILFSMTIKWQPWGSRLLLPIFLLGSPLIGYLDDKNKFSKKFSVFLILSFSIFSIPYLTLNDSRPLVPLFREDSPFRTNYLRWNFSNHPYIYDQYSEVIAPFYMESSILYTERKDQYFSGNREIMDDYIEVMDAVNGLDVGVIGLELNSNNWEYPIWVFANRHAEKGLPEFIHVANDNLSSTLDPIREEWPEYVISTKRSNSFFTTDLKYQYIVDTRFIDLLQRLP